MPRFAFGCAAGALPFGIVGVTLLLTLGTPPAFTQALGEALSQFERDHVARALAMTAELVHVLDLFGQAAIPVFTFKGPALAQQLYGGLARREYVDIDLLVPPDREDESARLGAQGVEGARIDFVDSGSASLGLGVGVMEAAKAARAFSIRAVA